MSGFCASLILVAALAPPPNSPAPGGYWSTGEQRERRGEPPDGDDELTIGSVLFSLGLLRAGAAGVTLWMARTPGRCPITDESGCSGMEIYGWLGFGEGGLMIGTGLTYMIIGGSRRSRHRRWESGRSAALRQAFSGLEIGAARLQLGPWVIPASVDPLLAPELRAVVGDVGVGMGGGAQLRVRF